ncbi:MAG: phage tail protein [Zoogloeaceae bacterium]|nr:phage tail protein [Zoogloeaceae bacterium]
MIEINIRTNFPEVARALDQLGQDVGDKALVRALNKTVDQGKTAMAREISRTYWISSSAAKDRLDVRKAKRKGGALRFEAVLEATRRGQGRSMNLIHFVEQSVSLAQAKKRGKAGTLQQVHFKIKRGGPAKFVRGAFIANRGRTVFIREGKKRLPIKAVNTLDVPQMFNTKAVAFAVRDVMLTRFQSNFARELRAVLKGYAR